MRREPHVRFCERAAVRFHRATHLVICCRPVSPIAALCCKGKIKPMGFGKIAETRRCRTSDFPHFLGPRSLTTLVPTFLAKDGFP